MPSGLIGRTLRIVGTEARIEPCTCADEPGACGLVWQVRNAAQKKALRFYARRREGKHCLIPVGLVAGEGVSDDTNAVEVCGHGCIGKPQHTCRIDLCSETGVDPAHSKLPPQGECVPTQTR